MEKINDVLKKRYKVLDVNLKLTEAIIRIYYKDIVGHEIYKISEPIALKGKTLFLGVKNSVWAHHLLYFKEEIIKKINSRFSKRVVRDLRFVVSWEEKNREEEKYNEFNEELYIPLDLTNVNLPDEKTAWIDRVCADIDDEVLKEKLKEIMKKDVIFKMQKR